MIRFGTHLNSETYTLENEILKLEVLRDYGAKIASIVHLEREHEFLFQPTLGRYELPIYGDDFYKYDTSGIDDTIPTIDADIYPESKVALMDHGDTWAQVWEYEVVGDTLICTVELKSLPLKLVKKLKLVENRIEFKYELINETDEDIMYLWAFHGLNVFNDETEMFFRQEGTILNVIDGTDYDFDYKKLVNYEDGSENKYYFEDEITDGYCGLDYRDVKLKYILDYDTKINAYLGVWITKGGFKGEYNCALESASGYYDSLSRAYENDKYSTVKAKSSVQWDMNVIIEEY